MVSVGKRSLHGSGSMFVSPHGWLATLKGLHYILLKGHSQTNKAELWAAAAEAVNDRGSPVGPLRHLH